MSQAGGWKAFDTKVVGEIPSSNAIHRTVDISLNQSMTSLDQAACTSEAFDLQKTT